jgi:hypothetical protein
MKWERELSDALRDLARTVDDVPENPATEQRLLDAFDRRQWQQRGRSRILLPVANRKPDRLRWTLAAAAVALVVGGWWMTAHVRRSTDVTQGARQAAASTPAPGPTGGEALTLAGPPARPAAPVTTAAPAPPANPNSGGPVQRARQSRRPPAVAARAAEAQDDFIALPAASQLPTFESGMIVRVQLPVSSLPAYGFLIMPDEGRTPVTADVLVGQDGQPRAIRLVSMQTGSRRRQ